MTPPDERVRLITARSMRYALLCPVVKAGISGHSAISGALKRDGRTIRDLRRRGSA
jgi:hypothetical protein